jgi:RNA polymerase sigma-70 factor (ECF subfamily)
MPVARLTHQIRLERYLNEARRLDQATAHPKADSLDRSDPLERLVEEFHQPVTRLAHRLLGWSAAADVEDVVHDVFLAAFKQRNRFRGEASEWTWLAAITINGCRTHRRRQLLRFNWLRSFRPTESKEESNLPEQDETARRVRDAVATLPRRDREVIVLHHLEEMSVAQVSEVTGDSAGAIEVRLHRARKRLKEILGTE